MLFRYVGIRFRSAALLIATCMDTAAVAASACPTGPALTPGTQHCSSNLTGKTGGFAWSIWSSGSGGCITPSGNTAAFKATWNEAGDFLARMGFQWDETKTFDKYGTVTADYAYTKSGTAGSYSFIGIYGWSNNPLIEYYIVDDWFGAGAPPTGGGTFQGAFTADSGAYNIYTNQRVNQPSIHGTTTFMQFFSIRQTPRQCGHITVSDHWKQWKGMGLELGKMYEAKLLVEAGGGTGSIDYSVGTMTLGPATTVNPSQRTPGFTRSGGVYLDNGKAGVLSLHSLNGTLIRSAGQTGSEPARLATGNLPKGLYVLRFQEKGGSADSRMILIH
jgi:hypothetical protein